MADRSLLISAAVLSLCLASCSEDPPAEPVAKKEPLVILRPKPKVLSAEQRASLGFPDELIREVETAAEAVAEPFFEQVMMKSANLKGDVMIATGRLAGFSVRTGNADDLIASLSRSLRTQGYLIFRSGQNFGSVPDIVTVVRGNSSYDILTIQQTESAHYHLDTKGIIKWLRGQQREGSFVITGAGADWVEARFVNPPRDMKAFARNVAAFAPDVLREEHRTVDRLAAWMEETNGFRLVWD
jgi:hypothetical protein